MHIFNAEGSARWGPVPFMKKTPAAAGVFVKGKPVGYCLKFQGREGVQSKPSLASSVKDVIRATQQAVACCKTTPNRPSGVGQFPCRLVGQFSCRLTNCGTLL